MAAEATDILIYKDSLIILTVAGVIVPLMHRVRIHAVVGFLAAGALLGPHGLGVLAGKYPFLHYITMSDGKDLSAFGDLGIIFLLFLIGVELSIQRLITMRRLVFGLGSLQVIFSTLALTGVLMLFQIKAAPAILIGAALALSSTAIVIQILAQQKRLSSSTGRASFSILLFQDLAVIPILFLVDALSVSGEKALFSSLAMALVQALIAISAIVIIGRLIMRPLFRQVAETESSELFVAATLLVIVASSVVAAAAGISMALGAFVAGLLIAEIEYNRLIQSIIDPFKGLLLGVFFFTVGMEIDLVSLFSQPLVICTAVLALIVLKALVIIPTMRMFGFSRAIAIKTALFLAPAGEFAFVVIGLSESRGLIPSDQATFIMAVSTLSMATIPFLGVVGNMIGKKIALPPDPQQVPPIPAETKAQAIIVGSGRVGQITSEMLDRHGVPYVVLDRDASVVAERRKTNRSVYFGNAQDPAVLAQCNLDTASAIIITSHRTSEITDVVLNVRRLRRDIPIISRARDAGHARQLYALGVTLAVPDTLEASLQLSEAALINLGVPQVTVIASIHEKREEIRKELKPSIPAPA